MKQEVFDHLRELLVAMDVELTGNSINKAKSSMSQQEDKLLAELLDRCEHVYYLSDCGLSRICLDLVPYAGDAEMVVLSNVSTAKVKGRWVDSPEVERLRTELVKLMSDYVESQVEL
jgi:hypothetical protein